MFVDRSLGMKHQAARESAAFSFSAGRVRELVEADRDEIGDEDGGENLSGIGARVDDTDEWVRRDEKAEECGQETGGGCPLEPARQGAPEGGCSYERYGKHCQVRDLVVSEAGVGEELIGLLCVNAGGGEENEREGDGGGGEDGVGRRTASRMEAREPLGNEMVPAAVMGRRVTPVKR